MKFVISSVILSLVACGETENEGKEIVIEPASEDSSSNVDTADTSEIIDTAVENQDLDGDGYTVEDGDCNDQDSSIHPNTEDIPADGIDQDCDGEDAEPDEISVEDIIQGDLIITEIMKAPTYGEDDLGEWFEIYNPTIFAINLEGLVVKDDGADAFTVTDAYILAPEEHLVFGGSLNAAQNGGANIDLVYNRNNFALANGSDEVILANQTLDIDAVAYDSVNFPDQAGASLSLTSGGYSHTLNDDWTYWCEAQSSYGDGDFGTPGGLNDDCPETPDADGDGYDANNDCDDDDPNIHPNQDDQICNGVDSDCDGEIDEDWLENDYTNQSYEPNEDLYTAYHLGSDPNINTVGQSTTIDSSTADLDQYGVINASAYLFDDADVDTFVFTSYDSITDGGFDVEITSVPAGVDIAVAVDYINEDGVLTTSMAVENSAGAGGDEVLCLSDLADLSCLNNGYNSGTFIVRVFSVGGSDCSDSYQISIVD